MEAAGYPEDSRTRVARFIMKKDLKKDPENQVREKGTQGGVQEAGLRAARVCR